MSHEFTKEQEVAFGQIMADNFGGHFQTGFDDEGFAYVYVQTMPHLTPVRYRVYESGTVTVVE